MKKNRIIITETKEYFVNIEAETLAEAEKLALGIFKKEKPTSEPIMKVTAERESIYISKTQQNSLHLWLKWYVIQCIEKGATVKEIIQKIENKKFTFTPTVSFLKEHIFKVLAKAISGVDSTKKLDRHENLEQTKREFEKVMKDVADIDPIAWPSQQTKDYQDYN